jgi:hypothetical protein
MWHSARQPSPKSVTTCNQSLAERESRANFRAMRIPDFAIGNEQGAGATRRLIDENGAGD